MDIRYSNLNELLESDENAAEYFTSLPESMQNALHERGGGINNFDELMHFSDIISERGYKDTTRKKEKITV